MKFKTALLLIATTVALTSGLAPASNAQSSQTTKKVTAKAAKAAVPDRVIRGSVVLVTPNSIMIRSKGRDLTFVLDPETKEKGEIAVKKEVTVHYRDQNKKHIATNIEEMTPAAASKSKG